MDFTPPLSILVNKVLRRTRLLCFAFFFCQKKTEEKKNKKRQKDKGSTNRTCAGEFEVRDSTIKLYPFVDDNKFIKRHQLD